MDQHRNHGDDDDDEEDLDGDRHDLAERRTGWAMERTLLAKERTFAAWLRTGLASFAVGIGVARLLGDIGPPWLALGIGASLILAGTAIVTIGFVNYRRPLERLREQGARGLPAWALGALTAVMILIGLAEPCSC